MLSKLILVAAAPTCAYNISDMSDQTDITASLNGQIAASIGRRRGVYKGGAGILVRTPDIFANSDKVVLPATFWSNDIRAASQLYPSGNPWCPHGKTDGYMNIDFEKCDDSSGPWDYATVAAVLGVDGMYKLIPHFADIQKDDYGYGVFYPTDANSVDGRCIYDNTNKGWDCPGGWVDSSGKFTSDGNRKGSGYYQPGNPDAGLGGGGSGCHFDANNKALDQVDAIDNNVNLVKDANCQCNMDVFRTDWNKWVKQWVGHSTQKKGFEWRKWLAGGQKAPQWAVDTVSCWMNNPRDMINLQNAFWDARGSWLNNMAPSGNRYWGWNEVPVSNIVDLPSNWDAIMIKLPATLGGNCGDKGKDSLNCLQDKAKSRIEQDLGTWLQKGKIKTGVGAIGQRPGSYLVLVHEFWNGIGFERRFYCESWTTPGKKYKIVYEGYKDKSDPGKCYLDSAQFFDTIVL